MNKNNINSQILTANKDKVSKKSMNEARNNRYNLLTNFCVKNNILHLFIAHHKDDNLETGIVLSDNENKVLELTTENYITGRFG